MGALFDDYGWLGRKRRDEADESNNLSSEHSQSTGTSHRDMSLDCLAAGPLRRNSLRKALRIRRKKVLTIVRDLLAEGLVVETESGSIALVDFDATPDDPVLGTDDLEPGTDDLEPGTDDPVPGTDDPVTRFR